MSDEELKKVANEVRKGIVTGVHAAKSGHPGGSLGAADIMTYLYFEEMNVDPADPRKADRDRFVLSKGHCAPGPVRRARRARVLPQGGPRDAAPYRQPPAGPPQHERHPGRRHVHRLARPGHLRRRGHGRCRQALGRYMVYALLGDGESEEGQVWEAAMFAGNQQLDNLCVIVDHNGLQIDGPAEEVMTPCRWPQDPRLQVPRRGAADGNDFDQIRAAFAEARATKGQPTAIIAETMKGKGVSFMENQVGWHGKAPNDEQFEQAMAELAPPPERSSRMADVKKIATRVSYGEALVELANEHDDFVVLDADLAAATQTGKFKAACPDRFFDVGIAESNLMGVAAGIATTGRVAFASTFAMFAAGRAFEQVRNSIGYPHLNVKIGATHAGISVGEDGATHQCCEDIALMRVIPGMTVIVPADDVEARAVTRAAYECDGPVYMRFARLASPVINDPETYKFELGRGIVMREGADVTIIACGLMVGEALEAAEQLAAEGIDAEVINMHTIKPIDADLIVKSATKTGHVVTVEEHSVIGGLGSAVADVLCEQCPTPLKKIGVNDTFGESGPGAELLHKYGLDAANIVATTKEFLA